MVLQVALCVGGIPQGTMLTVFAVLGTAVRELLHQNQVPIAPIEQAQQI